MNNVNLVGRLTKDPELQMTTGGTAVARFTLAVDRPFKNKDGERDADFLSIVAWRQTAEICDKYLRKGHKCGVSGSIQTRSFDDKDGNRRYVTEVMADKVYFLESKNVESESEQVPVAEPVQGKKKTQNKQPAEIVAPPINEDDLPF